MMEKLSKGNYMPKGRPRKEHEVLTKVVTARISEECLYRLHRLGKLLHDGHHIQSQDLSEIIRYYLNRAAQHMED
jgi:hypothetical protein